MLPEARITVTVARFQAERQNGVSVAMIYVTPDLKVIKMSVTVAQNEVAHRRGVFGAASSFRAQAW